MSLLLPFSADVYFQGQGPQTQLPNPYSFCLKEEEFSHSMLSMEFWGGDVQAQSVSTGSPVQVNFGRPPAMRSFYGYVNHVGRVNNSLASTAEARNALCVYCVGASWPMKGRNTQVYQSMTNTQIIESVAAMFGLGAFVVPYNSLITPSKQQAGHSYWEFCVELAKEIGYTFYCDGIQLVAKPRNTNPGNLSSLLAVYDYRKNPGALPIFNPVVGSNNPGGGQLRTRQIAGINPRTVQPYFVQIAGSNTSSVLGVVQEDPPFVEIEQFTTNNVSQATLKLQGEAQENQLYMTATATGPGNPQAAPGQTIYVQNANGSQNGLWYICGVEHLLNAKNYVMTLYLGRDSIGQTATLQVQPQTSFPQEKPLLVSNTWTSAA